MVQKRSINWYEKSKIGGCGSQQHQQCHLSRGAPHTGSCCLALAELAGLEPRGPLLLPRATVVRSGELPALRPRRTLAGDHHRRLVAEKTCRRGLVVNETQNRMTTPDQLENREKRKGRQQKGRGQSGTRCCCSGGILAPYMKDFQAVQTAPSVRGHRALVLNCCTVATLLLSAAAPGVDDSLAAAAHRPPAPRRRALSPAERAAVTDASFGASAREFAALGSEPYARDRDLVFVDAPGAWHQQVARIVDHRFSTFDELFRFALDAKKAGVGALMLVQIQKTEACPGAWYNGLQLCDHINGSYPVPDGSLSQWRRMLSEIAPMRLMWCVARPGCVLTARCCVSR